MSPPQFVRITSPHKIVQMIIKEHGRDILKEVSHVSVITELFGNEDHFLSYIEKIKALLFHNGYIPKASFRACAQDVRSESGLKRLYTIVDEKRYSFTLEVFSARRKIMGSYKGIPLEQVEQILRCARKVGFEEIKLNYIAGIDSLGCFEEGVRRLRYLGILDSVGLSIFTVFFPDQLKLRNEEAWRITYYLNLIEILTELGIGIYEPSCFEMGYPPALLRQYLRD